MSYQDLPNAQVTVAFNHAGQTYAALLPINATLEQLAQYAFETIGVPLENQKWLISPKPGMVKPPFDGPSQPELFVKDIAAAKKIMLLGSTPAQIASLNKSVRQGSAHSDPDAGKNGPIKAARPARTRDWKILQDEINYTFQQIKPLEHLPFPERSVAYLERLRDDPGVKAAMIKHKWSVPLLTELDPAENTSHESRTLGLNKNRGETILLRLRTDAYDGYRDYKTVRTCLCHELAHNVHGDHDRDFFDLMKLIEEEVNRNDWKHGGHALGEQEYYDPGQDPAQAHREWTGGIRRLGSTPSTSASSASAGSDPVRSRREAMAKAAEDRSQKKSKDAGT